MNVNLGSAKQQRDIIIHGIEMTNECVVFLKKEYIVMHDLAPCFNFRKKLEQS